LEQLRNMILRLAVETSAANDDCRNPSKDNHKNHSGKKPAGHRRGTATQGDNEEHCQSCEGEKHQLWE